MPCWLCHHCRSDCIIRVHWILLCTPIAVIVIFVYVIPYSSFFDSPDDRYLKLKRTINRSVIIQLGITAFRYYRDLNLYKATPYSFYIFPRNFGSIDHTILLTSSTLQFLCDSKFDFNKVTLLFFFIWWTYFNFLLSKWY